MAVLFHHIFLTSPNAIGSHRASDIMKFVNAFAIQNKLAEFMLSFT